jgi:tol-pal system protein YbgF
MHRLLDTSAAQRFGAAALTVALIIASSAVAAQSSDGLALLLEQNQQLQAEIQALRRQLDEQGFELKKLQRDSLNRYTDVDQRLSDLESGASAVTTTPAAPTPARQAQTQEPAAASPRARGTLEPAVLSEQQLYQMAYDSVINSQFERSIAEFDQYLSLYANGRFVANAHYWKGQAYLYLDRYEEARAAYDIILDQYPDSNKLPDAMYGLGLAYQGMGNVQRARQLLTDIKRRFPNTGVANLADTRLLSL